MHDLIILGGGTGGLRLALNAASAGAKTLLIEPGHLGGTCLNTGCIPTKALLHASHLYHQVGDLKAFGIKARATLDFSALMKRVRGIVQQGRSHIKKSVPTVKKLTYVKGKARFLDSHTVLVGKKRYRGKKFVIATGAYTWVPPIPGLDATPYFTNANILELKKLPKSLIIIGGGYISMEFATFFSQLGTKVTILERGPGILCMLDADVREVVHQKATQRGVDIQLNVNTHAVKHVGGKVNVAINDVRKPKSKKKTIHAEALLVATGRRPQTHGLDLEAASVTLGKRGEIVVNDRLQTSQKHIYAIGDVTGRAMFAHAAKREAQIVLQNAVHNKRKQMDFDHVPWAVFTSPPVSGVGYSEKQARKAEVYKAEFKRAGRAVIMGEDEGFVKIIFEKKSRKLLGCVIVGVRADDLIHEIVAVMNSGTPTLDVIQNMIHVHPTVSEVMESLHYDHRVP